MQNSPDIGPLLKEQRLAAIKPATTAFQSPLSHRSTHLRKEVGLSTRRVELVTPSGLVDVQAFSPTRFSCGRDRFALRPDDQQLYGE